MSRFHFPPDTVRTGPEALAAAVAAMNWRRSFYPRQRPVPAPTAPPKPAWPINLPAVEIKFGRIRVADVIDTAAAIFGITRDELIGHGRRGKFMLPRHAAMAVARRVTQNSLPELGRMFGDRDHTTILSACRKAEHHTGLQAAVADLMAALENAAAPPAEEGEGAL
jgi:hypothetical protein